MDRWIERLAVVLALGVVALALVVPVGLVFIRSFEVEEVVLTNGTTLRAVGEVERVEPDRGEPFYLFATQARPDAERSPQRRPASEVARVQTVLSLDHYRTVLSDARTPGLLLHSLVLSVGAVLFALLFGLPLAYVLARTNLPGRRVWATLCLGPAILPPFFVAMGGARVIGPLLHGLFGLEGGSLQLANAMVVFGCVLFPLVALLVGRALAEVPVGPWEAAVLLGGRRAAWAHVTRPAILPAVFGAAMLVFVLAWSDFAVPDLLGFLLPAGSSPVHVFPTEILLQWKQMANTGRAVATGAPFVVLTGALLAVSFFFLRRSPVLGGGEGSRGRPVRGLSPRGRTLAFVGLLLLLGGSFVMPLVGVARWGLGAGESVPVPGATAGDTTSPTVERPRLFDFAGAIERTPGVGGDLARWIKSALGAAVLATLTSVVLVRWALARGRGTRALVLAIGALPLAIPGLVMTVGTQLLWLRLDVAWVQESPLRSALVLAARFLPFALVAVWLALREVRRGHEEAAALLGAGPLSRAARIWGPLAGRGVLAAALVVLVLSLREIDAVILVDPRIFPLRIYDKIHFTRLADEANLAFLYVAIVLLPALLAVLVLRPRPHDAA